MSAFIGALAMLAAAVVLLAHRHAFTLGALLICLGAVAGSLALGVVVSGLLGRRGEWMTGGTIVMTPLLLAALVGAWWIPLAVLSDLPVMPTGGTHRTETSLRSFSSWLRQDTSLSPVSEIPMGTGHVALDVDPDEAIAILVDVGLADITATVPEGWTVDTGGGTVPVPGDAATTYRPSGAYYLRYHGQATFLSPAAAERGPDRTLAVTVGCGSVHIEQGAK